MSGRSWLAHWNPFFRDLGVWPGWNWRLPTGPSGLSRKVDQQKTTSDLTISGQVSGTVIIKIWKPAAQGLNKQTSSISKTYGLAILVVLGKPRDTTYTNFLHNHHRIASTRSMWWPSATVVAKLKHAAKKSAPRISHRRLTTCMGVTATALLCGFSPWINVTSQCLCKETSYDKLHKDLASPYLGLSASFCLCGGSKFSIVFHSAAICCPSSRRNCSTKNSAANLKP